MILLAAFGGLACGLFLGHEYFQSLWAGERRLPWSALLGTGWLCFAGGLVLVCVPSRGTNWLEGVGECSLLLACPCWWAAAVAFALRRA